MPKWPWWVALAVSLPILVILILDAGGWGTFALDIARSLLAQAGITIILYGILLGILTPIKERFILTWRRRLLTLIFSLAAVLALLMFPALFGRRADAYDAVQTAILILAFYLLVGRYRLALLSLRPGTGLSRFDRWRRARSAPVGTPDGQASPAEQRLYQDLLVRVLGDQATAERLIEYERQKAPHASREELIRSAVERWIQDNTRK